MQREGGDALAELDILKGLQSDEYFIKILDEYEKLVFSICYRMTRDYFDAEDLTQETFLALYKALPAFDRQNPKAFVTRIATNKCLDYLKKAERRASATEEEELAGYPAKGAEPEKILLEKELNQVLYKACRSLKPPYREVAIAYYCRHQTAAQIAELSGKKVKTIQTQILRAKLMLQKYLKKEEIVWHT